MAFIKGYKYTSEQAAINAREQCDVYYGIPVSPDDVTKHWVNYEYAELNIPKFWYIISAESLLPILGQAIEFEVITNAPINE